MTQILPFISFWENLQLNVVLENRNLARLYHRSLVGCQASHLKSTLQMIIKLSMPELSQYTENSNNKIHTLNTYVCLAMLRNRHLKFSKFCPYFLPMICFSRATWKMKIIPPPAPGAMLMNCVNTVFTNTLKSHRRKKYKRMLSSSESDWNSMP